MITTLQNFFLKHNKWLFGGLLIVIIVTFVLTIGPQSFFGSNTGPQTRSLQFYGYDLSSEADSRALIGQAEISAVLSPELQLRQQQLVDYGYMRVAALGQAERLGIPAPTRKELSDFISSRIVFSDPQTGAFSPDRYDLIVNSLRSGGRYTEDAINRVLREDCRIHKVLRALGGPDYSLPFETLQDYIDFNTSYSVILVHADYARFAPQMDPTDAELEAFYNENPGQYEVPESLDVTALLFKAEAYLDEVADPARQDLEAYFSANRARYEQARQTEEGAELPELTLDEVLETVIDDWKRQQATRIAAKKSEQFSLKLWQDGVALDSETYKGMLADFKVATRGVPAYSRGRTPTVENVPAALLESMWVFASNPNRYFSDIAQIADGAVILVKHGLTPARQPSFEEVRSVVETNYKATEKRRLFAVQGDEWRQALQAAPTAEVAETASALGLTTETLDSFTGQTVPQSLLTSTLWEQVQYLPKGGLTPMVMSGNRGTLAFVVSKEVPSVDVNDPAFQAFAEQRSSGLSEAMGWARLREITDSSLAAVLGEDTGSIE